MKVNVEYLGHIREIIDADREEEVRINEKATVADLLMVLSEKHGEPFEKAIYQRGCEDVKSNYIITVNGYLLNQLNGIKTKLKDGDKIALLPIVSGG